MKSSNTKKLNIYFLKIEKLLLENNERKSITRDEILEKFSLTQLLPVDIKQVPSRYQKKDNAQFAALYGIEILHKHKTRIMLYDDYITGIFLRRRNNNWPYSEEGTGYLQEISFENGNIEIAEATYFAIDPIMGIMIWVSNRNVGGFERFADYINEENDKIYKNCGLPNNEHIIFSHIINLNSFDDFRKMTAIRSFEMSIFGNAGLMSSLITSKNSAESLKKAIDIAKDLSGNNIKINVSLGRTAKKDATLNKSRLEALYEIFKPIAKDTKDIFKVKGKIDDETRIIDLLEDILTYNTEITYKEKYTPINLIFKNMLNAYKEKLPQIKKTTGKKEHITRPIKEEEIKGIISKFKK